MCFVGVSLPLITKNTTNELDTACLQLGEYLSTTTNALKNTRRGSAKCDATIQHKRPSPEGRVAFLYTFWRQDRGLPNTTSALFHLCPFRAI